MVRQLLDEGIGVLFVDKHLQLLDVPFVVHDPLAQGLDVGGQGRRLGRALVVDVLATLRVRLQLALEALKLAEVLVLDLGVLNLDHIELLFVLARSIAEAGCELVGLLGIQLL